MAIIDANRDALKGARVLDLASHDGRWSFAALQAGAESVVGVEGREHLVRNAESTFAHYGMDPQHYQFIVGDIFQKMPEGTFDVVFCLGFFYHTLRHAELLSRIERTQASLVVIDTEVVPLKEEVEGMSDATGRAVFQNPNIVHMFRDPVDSEEMAIADDLARDGYTLVGRPSRAVLSYWAEHFGFSMTTHDWQAHFVRFPEHESAMQDYSERWRETFFWSRK